MAWHNAENIIFHVVANCCNVLIFDYLWYTILPMDVTVLLLIDAYTIILKGTHFAIIVSNYSTYVSNGI